MMQPLRKAHLRVWIGLAIVTYAAVILGLITRVSTTPVNRNLNWEHLK